MTVRQKKLGQEIVKNALKDKPDNMTTLLSNVGYARTVAEHRQGVIIQAPGVQQAIQEASKEMLGALEQQGVTPYFVAGKIRDLLEAKKIIRVAGEIESVEDNYQAIDKGIAHAAKFGIGGGYKTDDNGRPTAAPSVQINVFNSPRVQSLVKEFEDRLKAELTRNPHEDTGQQEEATQSTTSSSDTEM